MTPLALLFAAALSAGNAEFEAAATEGAFAIVTRREKARLLAEGPSKGALAAAMLADPAAFAKADPAKVRALSVYQKLLDDEYAASCRRARERLGLSHPEAADRFGPEDTVRMQAQFESHYVEERAAACAKQAATLVGRVRPSEADFEAKDENTLLREMGEKVEAQQRTAVFEENLGFISRQIVKPVLEAANRERERQRTYLRRARCDAYAPSAMARDLTDRVVANVRDRRAKTDDPSTAWGVFPSVTNDTLRTVVHRRTMDRLAAKVAELPFEVRSAEVEKAMASRRGAHRKAKSSAEAFRQAWTRDLSEAALAALLNEALPAEREELRDYLAKRLDSDEIMTKAVGRRVGEELMPKLGAIRRALASAEFQRTWPTLADRTWYPDAATADGICARSDYASAVRAWRELSGTGLSKGEDAMEESSARADKAVAGAFEIARGAVSAQMRIVDEVHPSVLAEAQEKKRSFWSRTPDFGKVVAMLTVAVAARWNGTKVRTLWPKGEMPENADAQHAELFPSVKKRIELVAKAILAEMDSPEETPADPELLYSIVVSREGNRVNVKLGQGGKTLVEKTPKAEMDDFQEAMKAVGDKLGKEILKLK